jgi:hypothetical protein
MNVEQLGSVKIADVEEADGLRYQFNFDVPKESE